jgi:REP element-mobilizing transposase RayT
MAKSASIATIFTFVIMPNHVHLPATPHVTARYWLGPLKGFTAEATKDRDRRGLQINPDSVEVYVSDER